MPTSMAGPAGRNPARMLRARERVLRAALGAAAACALVVGAPSTAGAGTISSARPSTSTSQRLSLSHPVRAGQPYVTPGHQATQGPVGSNPSKAHGIELTVLNGLLHGEPIFNADFADPFALVVGDSVYAYATDTYGSVHIPGAHIPVIAITRATGFSGHYLGDALPTVPTWTVSGYQWAPSVWARPDGTYVLYYATPATHPINCVAKPTSYGCVETTHGPNTAMCISRATSTNPAGPFVDDSASPFVCPYAQGGAIDPSIYVRSDGTAWLLWKSDGDCCNEPTYIYSQQLSPDGLSTVGGPHELIGATQAWEGGLVEAPSMIKEGNIYWLFYSANLWGTPDYSIGIAACTSVIGPCVKPLDRAWHTSTNSANGQGYGGSEFFQTGDLIWMVHHGLVPGETGDYAHRRLYVDLLVFPPEGLPRVAARAPAAAVADATLYDDDPSLPTQPRRAFLHLLTTVPGSFSGVSSAAAIGDGQLACTDLAMDDSEARIVGALTGRHLSDFESYVVSEFAARYLCPKEMTEQTSDIQEALLDGS
ncbi:MAG: family 43 glycosylhydrolase [Acidimicrobiales bacterium]